MTAVARLKSPPKRAANKVLRQSEWLLPKRVLTCSLWILRLIALVLAGFIICLAYMRFVVEAGFG
jgi:hypothetical protein